MSFSFKISILFVFLGLKSVSVFGQRDSLIILFDQRRIEDQKKGMVVLGSWSLANMTSGLALRPKSTGEDVYFYQMNVLWNTVNLGIASLGYLNAKNEFASSEPMSVLEKQMKLEKSLLFNTGLDIAYVATGALLMEKARNVTSIKKHDQFRGYGRSLVLQGAFLFLFDLSFYAVESGSSKELNELLKLFYASPGGIGIQKTF